MIKAEITINDSGVTIDGTQVQSTDYRPHYHNFYSDYENHYPSVQMGHTYTIYLKDGTKIETPSTITYAYTIDFEVGALYAVKEKNGSDKHVAVCLEDDNGRPYLVAINDSDWMMTQEDPGRFEYEYEEFLAPNEIKELL